VKYQLRCLRERIEERLEETFWPVQTLSSPWKPWGIGVNQDRPRMNGRIWATNFRDHLSIGVTISYRQANPTFFKVTEDPESWDKAISRAFCWLAHTMRHYKIEWVVPDAAHE
jgi:hypothetical protein